MNIEPGQISRKEYEQLPEVEKSKVVSVSGEKGTKLFYEPEYFDTTPIQDVQGQDFNLPDEFQINKHTIKGKDDLEVEIISEDTTYHFSLHKSGQGFIRVEGKSTNNFEQNYRRETRGCDFGFYQQSFTALCEDFHSQFWGKLGNIETINIKGNPYKIGIFIRSGLELNNF